MMKRGFSLVIGLLVVMNVFPSGGGSGVTGEEALERLVSGNGRYSSGARQFPHQEASRREETAAQGQKPFVTILSCADSRVPPEHLFDAGIGDLFIVRVAGNVADTDEIGTVEYGVEHLGTPLLVVLGHTKCGAVTAVYNGDEVGGSIPLLVDNIIPAAERAREANQGKPDGEAISAAIEENVYQSMADLLAGSPIIRELVEEGKLKVVGAVYHLDTGKVEWLGTPPGLESLAESVASGHQAKKNSPGGVAFLHLGAALFFLAVYLLVYLVLFGEKTKTVKVRGGTKLIIAALALSLSLSAEILLLLLLPAGGGSRTVVLIAALLVMTGGLGFALASMAAFGKATTRLIRHLQGKE